MKPINKDISTPPFLTSPRLCVIRQGAVHEVRPRIPAAMDGKRVKAQGCRRPSDVEVAEESQNLFPRNPEGSIILGASENCRLGSGRLAVDALDTAAYRLTDLSRVSRAAAAVLS